MRLLEAGGGSRRLRPGYSGIVATGFRTVVALGLLSALAGAQTSGTTPKEKPSDYQVQQTVGDTVVAADYLLHSVGTGSGSFLAPDYLVVEVAVYPAKGHPVTVSSGQFTLRVNGREVLPTELPSVAAATVRFSSWDTQGGRPGPASQPPPAANGIDRPTPRNAPEAITLTAFPNGEWTGPTSGNLYFGYSKKTKSIKTLDLIWRHGKEETVINLF
jgi:hypothetical protein